MLRISHRKTQITKEDVSSKPEAVKPCKTSFVNDEKSDEKLKEDSGSLKKKRSNNNDFIVFERNYLFIG